MKFKAVSSQVNLPELEQETINFWQEQKIFERSVKERSEDNSYVFVDGPPFVSGLPHYGHLLTSIAKDLVPRYQTMLGKRVRRVWGWDCHGLPIEDKVNQKFGIKSSTQLEKEMGVEQYVKECRNYVENVTSDWQWYVQKIGRWVDMANAYYTMHPEFMESVIWAFKQIHDKGLIYKGKRVSLFSTDTSTPVSEFEVAMDADNYRDVEDLSIFVKFSVGQFKGHQDVSLVAWTTTPWTIPANFALAVNAKFTYCLVEYDNQKLIVAKERLDYTFELTDANRHLVKVLEEFTGDELEGVHYSPVYDFLKSDNENDYKVYLSAEVTADDGTGVLHLAPAFGEVDYSMGQKYGISALADIDEEGKMLVGDWKGIYLRDASALIAEDLQRKGNLFRSEVYKHRLPFYRGEHPLIYMAQDAYFINIQQMKSDMLRLNDKINWIPKHIKNGRFKNTVETAPDWCISRNRYWATIMPIWRSEDGDEIVVGSFAEMAELTDQISSKEVDGKIKYFFEEKAMDLHRDVCDKIIFKKDGKEYRRVPEVLDVWMDSGSVPFAEYHYPFENQDLFEKNRPADFIIEYVPQVRAWFNVMHRISTIVFDDVAFTNAICHGTIAGNDGRKMSKSFGNYPDPKAILEKYGADALRLYLMGSPIVVGEDMNFNEEGVDENYKFLLVLWNSYKYFVDYASIHGWSCDLPEAAEAKNHLTILDRWILSRLTQLVLDCRKSLDSYNIPEATRALKDFIANDYSTWYIRRSRDRINGEDETDRGVCLAVMYGVLCTYCKLAAPVIPFITEQMFTNLTEESSVHLQFYPEGNSAMLDQKLNDDMAIVRQLVVIGHAQRKEANLKLRQPLAEFAYQATDKLSEQLEQVLAEEINVKKVSFDKKSDQLTGKMDLKLTPELEEEGKARDLIRAIQVLRKEAGLTKVDKVTVVSDYLPATEELQKVVLKQTNADSLTAGDSLSIEKVA